jgi:TetR/AcrR family transcriptional regulator, transcriptional repressor for nem operon
VPRPKKFDPDVAVGQAMNHFWSNGYAKSTPQSLGECMGLGRGSLYNAFSSKRELFELALRRYYEEESRELLAILRKPGPVKERIRELLLRIVELDMADPARRGCLAVNVAVELAPHDEAAKAIVDKLFRQTERHLQSAIERGQSTGEISSETSAEALASFLLNATIGMRVLCKTQKTAARLRRVIDVAMKTL